MSTRTTDYREAIDHLPEGATLVLSDVSWEDYETLLEDLADRPGVRITYDQGKVEIMSPLREHEKYKVRVSRIPRTPAGVRGLLEPLTRGWLTSFAHPRLIFWHRSAVR